MVASGYSRVGTGTWHNDFAVPLTLTLAVDEGDPWAASVGAAAAVAAGERRVHRLARFRRRSAAAAGALLSDGSADLALIPRTTSPFLSESLAWYSDLLGSAGPERFAELDELRQQHVRQPGHQGVPSS